MSFADFFQAATGNPPYDYQCHLACGHEARSDKLETLTGGSTCRSRLINIPTGLGKTAAVVLAWLWNRVQFNGPTWPRRLVYCLPMRTLVEQTCDHTQLWILRLALATTEDRSTERRNIETEIERHTASIEPEEAKEPWRVAVRAAWGDEDRAVEGALAHGTRP